MRQNPKDISILDCTLRDGSYLIDYQFTAEDTYIICLGLVNAGFKLIEVGHGTGLRSSESGEGKAAATDEEYLEAARSALDGSDAEFGMFLIPGVGEIEDLETAAGYGMGFVRIGTNITEIEQAEPFIKRAKDLGMIVSSNLMKSYVVPMDEFIKRAEMAYRFGADIVSIVDSAGGMFPHEVSEYVLRLKNVTDKKIGFHGHNNLQLAIANTLEAVNAGADVVDSSLQGMGRSAGNAQTEVLVTVLEKLGYDTGVDAYKAMDIGERIIKPMMKREQGVDDISLVSGIAQFHSSFYRIICEASEKFGVDPRRLIIDVSEIDRVSVTRELAEATALRLREKTGQRAMDNINMQINTDILKLKESLDPFSQAMLITDEITSKSKKTGKESIFSITLSKSGIASFPFIRQSASFMIGNMEASHLEEAKNIIRNLDGKIDWILLDESSSLLRGSKCEMDINYSSYSWYSEERVLRLGICALFSQKRPEGKVLILSDKENADLLSLSLKQQGIAAVSHANSKDSGNLRTKLSDTGAIVSFGAEYSNHLSAQEVSLLPKHVSLYAARPNAFSNCFVEASLARELFIVRVDLRASLAAEMSLVIETKRVFDMMGSTVLSGIQIVAGGVIGQRGNVVVDSLKEPTRVIGIADGSGGLLNTEEETLFKTAKEKVQEALIRNLYSKEF